MDISRPFAKPFGAVTNVIDALLPYHLPTMPEQSSGEQSPGELSTNRADHIVLHGSSIESLLLAH